MPTATQMKVVWTPGALLKQVDARAPRLMTMIGTEYTNDVKQRMRNAPRGGTNTNARGQKRSAPGEPPAPEFGDLIRSVRFQVRKIGTKSIMVETGSTLKKALYLEFGAARGRTQQARDEVGKFIPGVRTMSWILYPRPVWGPALMRLKRQMPLLIRRFAAGMGKRKKT